MFKSYLCIFFFFLLVTLTANSMEITQVLPLHAAILSGNLAEVVRLTTEGVPDSQTHLGTSILHSAAKCENVEIMRYLLEQFSHLDVNAQDDFGNTPLILAVRKGLCDVAHLLIQRKAQVDAVNMKLRDAMFYAIKGHYLTVIESLALAMCFTGAEWNSIINKLLPDANDSASVNKLFHQAVSMGCHQLAEHLCTMTEKVDVNFIVSDGESSALHSAAEKCDIVMMSLLISKGARVGDLDSEWRTPLHIVCLKGFLSGASLLLDSGAKLDVKDTHGWMPLHCAAEAGSCELLELILDKGVDINAAGYDEETALNIAAQNGCIDAVRFLVGEGADLKKDVKAPYETSLSSAVRGGQREIFKILINAWVVKEVFLECGMLDPFYNIGSEPSDRVKKIVNDGRLLDIACLRNDKALVQLLLDLGADVNLKDGSRNTPLHHVAHYGFLDLILLLVHYGADVNAVGFLLATPLHIAVYWGQAEAVKLLISQGADLNKQVTEVKTEEEKELEFYGMSPLHIAAARGKADIVQLLVSAGANIKAVTHTGHTVLHAAYLGGHPELADQLIGYGIDQYAKDGEGKMAYMYADAGMILAALPEVCIIC
jgi:ankyrin repeat protein